MDSAVIFDVDGVLLELTAAEEDVFFETFLARFGISGLSRDWDSYRTRNDDDIIAEILETHELPASEREVTSSHYVSLVGDAIATGRASPIAIAGAHRLLSYLAPRHAIGIATANLLSVARLRLAAMDLWSPVSAFAFGAEGGGAKRHTLARAIAATGLPRERIVYIGDNLNDVDAGLANGVHFIGFSTDPARRQRLAGAGARHLAGDHDETAVLIASLLGQA
ncbi:MAG: HAD family hydrolase [Alphaproteobacteria bacterium]|nr:HAD family hydrolase [Alphaproteobacteria bacterium]